MSFFNRSKQETSESESSSENTLANYNFLLKDLVLLSGISLAFFLFIVLFSYSPEDPGFAQVADVTSYFNYGGSTGAWLSSFILYLFGVFGFALPFGIGLGVWITLKLHSQVTVNWTRFWISMAGLLLISLAGSAMSSLFLPADKWLVELPESSGGVLGLELGMFLIKSFDLLASTLILLVIFASGISMLVNQSWLTISEVTGRGVWQVFRKVQELARKKGFTLAAVKEKAKNISFKKPLIKSKAPEVKKDFSAAPKLTATPQIAPAQEASTLATREEEPLIEAVKPAEVELVAAEDDIPPTPPAQPTTNEVIAESGVEDDVPFVLDEAMQDPTKQVAIERPAPQTSAYVMPDRELELPSIDLLDNPKVYEDSFSDEDLQRMSQILENALKEFGIEISVEAVLPGPVVTSFEIMPAPGVKISQIANLDKDLARVLSVSSVRVVDVIPGKSFMGIEIPNEVRQVVGFKDVLSSEQFNESKSPLTVGLGKDIAGVPVTADLARMPHVLIAGTTGSGKSVGVNSMIVSMLYKSRPDEVRFIMVDPKMLELSVYEDIPHLLTPVVTDMSEASNALRWSVTEMDRRYLLMSKLGVRNIAGYNEKVKEAIDAGKPILDPLYTQPMSTSMETSQPHPTLEPLPYIVVIVDEFADMIMVVGKQVEELIARLAQKARAAGIHLILATQRPSVNVITGLIKANIPTRMSFQVSSKIDSRTVLDQMGAEQLLGMGDMLYLPPGKSSPLRVHGAFVSDDEVHRVVDFVKSQGEPQYLDAICRNPDECGVDGSGQAGAGDESDPIYDEAVEFVIDSGRVSISGIQRRFKIGFNRAARIVEDMESAGVVSTAQAGGSRKVLVPKRD